MYDWESSKGLAAVVLDSTWALPMTAAALFANAVGIVTKGGYVDDLSRRSNRHVYQRGFMPRKGFAITLGNVISGAADTSKERRRRLITDHEDVHVWQARWLGPLYPVVYWAGWSPPVRPVRSPGCCVIGTSRSARSSRRTGTT